MGYNGVTTEHYHVTPSYEYDQLTMYVYEWKLISEDLN